MSAPASGWVALEALPDPYREALLTGTLPSGPGWAIYAANSASWLEAASLVFTVPFGLFALGYPLSWAYGMATNPATRERLASYFAKGQYFAGGLGVILPLGLAAVGVALLFMSWATVDLQRHQVVNRRGIAAGQYHYGLLLGPDRLVWRSPAAPAQVLSLARADITAVRTFQQRYTQQQNTHGRMLDLVEITWRQGEAEVYVRIPHVDVNGINATEAVQAWWGNKP